MMKIQVGDQVNCRLYNTPEGQFYGELFLATILAIEPNNERNRPYRVKRQGTGYVMNLTRKEIMGVAR